MNTKGHEGETSKDRRTQNRRTERLKTQYVPTPNRETADEEEVDFKMKNEEFSPQPLPPPPPHPMHPVSAARRRTSRQSPVSD